MISIYQKRIQIKRFVAIVCVLVSVFALFSVLKVHAQEGTGQSLSVTPTLFQMSAVPSQAWSSSVKVINNNKVPLTVYATVVNFAAQGESGEGKLIPLLEDEHEDASTLARWITISSEPIYIAPEQSYSIPFSVNVPHDAAPGGHFAAILIGTKPPESEGAIKVATSQIVTSLFFVRVSGDVVEDGVVREFRTAHSFVDTPKADFEVRFENKGNVHLQPQGDITITNMWGKERGLIPINQQTNFGNVLPNSIRKFEFSWKGEQSFSDIGRYKAVLTLAYGEGNRQFESSTAYFFVIPVKAGLIVLSFLIIFFVCIRLMVKAYVRRMLTLAGVDPILGEEKLVTRRSFTQEGDVRIVKKASIKAPMESGVSDLRSHLENAKRLKEKFKALLHFVVSYRLFFASALFLLVGICIVSWFILEATEEQRDYEVVIDTENDVTLSSEQILYNKAQEEDKSASKAAAPQEEQPYELILVNSSDTPGVAALLQAELEKKGYVIASLQSDFEESKERSVIVYDLELQEEALALSAEIGNALLSADPQTDAESTGITIYIGNDYGGG